jgi:protein TonB
MHESYLNQSDSARRRRMAAIALTLLAHVLIIWVLLNLSPSLTPRLLDRTLSTFQVTPPPPPRSIAEKPIPEKTGESSARAKNPAPMPPAPPAPRTPVSPLGLLPGGMALFDAADISKLPQHPEDRETASKDNSNKDQDSAAVYGPGEGPGGERVYKADWAKLPTNAELAPYLPADVPRGSWAVLVCRMVADNRVENCRAAGESPVGSGLARGSRLASWQFRILPPRVGSKKVIGGLVEITLHF